MSNPDDVTRRDFVLQSAALASMLVGGRLPLGAQVPVTLESQQAGARTMWYRRPASQWVEALPIGNGRLGAMVFGGVERERLQLNDSTLWSGGPSDWNNPGAPAVLADVRRLIAAERYAEADVAAKGMQGPYTQSYLPLGNLYLAFEHGDLARGGYRRELDISNAVASVRYKVGATSYGRDVFASHPDQVIVIRLSADTPGMISFTASLDSQLRHTLASDDGVLKLIGRAPANVDPSNHDQAVPVVYNDTEGMRFETHLAAQARGGRTWIENGELHVQGADEVVLRLAAATSFNGSTRSPGRDGRVPGPIAASQLRGATGKSFDQLRAAHVADHRVLFDRVALDLGPSSPGVPATADVPTDERINIRGASDPQLVETFFQYGRYLLIASSRPGGHPANLQGIWNDQVRPPWSSNFTININTEMNYWPAESTNLAELHEPLLDFIERLAVNGSTTARVNYGARGWVAHHNTDIWAQTAPVGAFGTGDPVWASWHGASAWLSRHMWEHFTYGGDMTFLRDRAYPVMRGASEFYLDFLVTDSKGHLVTSPSASPELKFKTPDGKVAALSAGATMDRALVWDLFTNTLDAAERLHVDDEFQRRVREARGKLIPYEVGSRGQLQEWATDFAEQDPKHRHFSHLFGVHPGHEITRDGAPELFAAARRSMELRGDLATGWSMAWKINFWARMQDGDHAYLLLGNLLKPAGSTQTIYTGGGGVYPNLFDAHPPFQIDGNFGATAGIAEMLLQSQNGEVHLLPALPSAWPTGRVRGLRARAGITVDIEWKNGAVERYSLLGRETMKVPVRIGSVVTEQALHAGVPLVIRPPATVRIPTPAPNTT